MKKTRITLQRASPQHIDHIMSWINNPDVVKNFQNFKRKFSKKEEFAFLKKILKSKNDFLFSIFTKDGDYVGQCAVNQISWQNKLGRLSLFITQNHWNQGYAHEAIPLLLDFAFKKLKLHKIWLVTWSTNKKAQRLYRQLGFKQEGVLRDEYFWRGKYHDMIRMAVLNQKFR